MKASVFIATSLDGYIARLNGELDWLPAPGADGEDFGYKKFMASVDVLIMGRHTFEKVLTFGAWPYGDKPVTVLTSAPTKLPAPPLPTVEYTAGAPVTILARLSARGLKHAYVDGGQTIQRFLAAKLIQRLIITRIPVILGSGISLFGPLECDVKLNHLTTHSYPNGLVQSEYEIAVG